MKIRICSIIIGTATLKPAKSFQKEKGWRCVIRAFYTQKTAFGTIGGAIETPGEAFHKFLFVALLNAFCGYVKFKWAEYRKVKHGDNSFFLEHFSKSVN